MNTARTCSPRSSEYERDLSVVFWSYTLRCEPSHIALLTQKRERMLLHRLIWHWLKREIEADDNHPSCSRHKSTGIDPTSLFPHIQMRPRYELALNEEMVLITDILFEPGVSKRRSIFHDFNPIREVPPLDPLFSEIFVCENWMMIILV